jgi:hypothetical protein
MSTPYWKAGAHYAKPMDINNPGLGYYMLRITASGKNWDCEVVKYPAREGLFKLQEKGDGFLSGDPVSCGWQFATPEQIAHMDACIAAGKYVEPPVLNQIVNQYEIF